MTRPVTTSGRFVRLGTASLQSEPGGPFVNLERINMQKYAARPAMAKALCDYIFHVEHNPKKAVELCAAATQVSNFKDWCWKARLGKGYYQLGLYREVHKNSRTHIYARACARAHTYTYAHMRTHVCIPLAAKRTKTQAEQQLLSSLKEQTIPTTYLQLSNIYNRLDQVYTHTHTHNQGLSPPPRFPRPSVPVLPCLHVCFCV